MEPSKNSIMELAEGSQDPAVDATAVPAEREI